MARVRQYLHLDKSSVDDLVAANLSQQISALAADMDLECCTSQNSPSQVTRQTDNIPPIFVKP